MAWTLIHAGWMHALLAALNAHDWTMRYVTHFSADVFSLLNSVIYVHKAALELQREHARARSRANSDGGDIEAATDWLRIYAAHAYDHADQIRRARAGSA